MAAQMCKLKSKLNLELELDSKSKPKFAVENKTKQNKTRPFGDDKCCSPVIICCRQSAAKLAGQVPGEAV